MTCGLALPIPQYLRFLKCTLLPAYTFATRAVDIPLPVDSSLPGSYKPSAKLILRFGSGERMRTGTTLQPGRRGRKNLIRTLAPSYSR